jgi:hypothetical protein
VSPSYEPAGEPARKVTDIDPLDTECSTCGRSKGERCVSLLGRQVTPHYARWHEAIEAYLKEVQ